MKDLYIRSVVVLSLQFFGLKEFQHKKSYALGSITALSTFGDFDDTWFTYQKRYIQSTVSKKLWLKFWFSKKKIWWKVVTYHRMRIFPEIYNIKKISIAKEAFLFSFFSLLFLTFGIKYEKLATRSLKAITFANKESINSI